MSDPTAKPTGDASCNLTKDAACNVVSDCLTKHQIADYCPMVKFWTTPEPPPGFVPPVADSDDTVALIGTGVVFRWGDWCWKFTGNLSGRPVNFTADDAAAVTTYDTCDDCAAAGTPSSCPARIKISGLASVIGSCLPHEFQSGEAAHKAVIDGASISVPDTIVLPCAPSQYGCTYSALIGKTSGHRLDVATDCEIYTVIVLFILATPDGASTKWIANVSYAPVAFFVGSADWDGTGTLTLTCDFVAKCTYDVAGAIGLGSGDPITITATTDDLTTLTPIAPPFGTVCPDPNTPPEPWPPGPPIPPPPPPPAPPPATNICQKIWTLIRANDGTTVTYCWSLSSATCLSNTGQTGGWGNSSGTGTAPTLDYDVGNPAVGAQGNYYVITASSCTTVGASCSEGSAPGIFSGVGGC